MNGTKSIEEHWIKKESRLRKEFKKKLLFSVLFSNLFIYLFSLGNDNQLQIKKVTWFNFESPQNKKVLLRTENYIESNSIPAPIPITIRSHDNKVIITKAWLHSIAKEESLSGQGTLSRIEIKEKDMNKIVALKHLFVKVFPYYPKKQISLNKKRRPYEFVF